MWPFSGSTLAGPFIPFRYCGSQRWMLYSGGGLTRGEYRGKITLLDTGVMQLAFCSEGDHCQLVSKFSPPVCPSLTPQGCSPYIHPPVCNDIGDCCDSTARPCTRPSWISWDSYVPTPQGCQGPPGWQPSLKNPNCTFQLCVICKLADSVPLAALQMKILNSIDPSMDSWGTPLITDFNLDVEPLTITPWAQPSYWFLIHLTVHPSNPYLSSSAVRMLSRIL